MPPTPPHPTPLHSHLNLFIYTMLRFRSTMFIIKTRAGLKVTMFMRLSDTGREFACYFMQTQSLTPPPPPGPEGGEQLRATGP